MTTTDDRMLGRSIRLEPDVYEALTLVAEDEDRRFNAVLRRACRELAVNRGRMCGSCNRVLSVRGQCPDHKVKKTTRAKVS